jgi:hypothetical protein
MVLTEESTMRLLEEITPFPQAARITLETEYGLESAEAFYAHAVKDPEGLQAALHVNPPELDRLVRLVEAYLPPDYIARCHQPSVRHPRGVIVD